MEYRYVRRGVFPARAQREVRRDYQNWLDRKGHYNDYIMQVVRVFYREIAGCEVSRVSASARDVITRQKDRVHRFPRALIGQLHRRGYHLLAISNSPEPMVRRFAKVMAFDDAIGHRLEISKGVYTGRSIVSGHPQPGASWMDKVALLHQYIAANNLHVDLRNSIMIGDTEGDVPLLSLVGRPIAFNPSLSLARIARRRGWRIVVERKDAVYEIRHADLIPVPGSRPRVSYGRTKD